MCSLWSGAQWSFSFNILWQSGFRWWMDRSQSSPVWLIPSSSQATARVIRFLWGLVVQINIKIYDFIASCWWVDFTFYYIWPSGSVQYGSSRWDLAVGICSECWRNLKPSWRPTPSSGDTGLPAAALGQGRRLENEDLTVHCVLFFFFLFVRFMCIPKRLRKKVNVDSAWDFCSDVGCFGSVGSTGTQTSGSSTVVKSQMKTHLGWLERLWKPGMLAQKNEEWVGRICFRMLRVPILLFRRSDMFWLAVPSKQSNSRAVLRLVRSPVIVTHPATVLFQVSMLMYVFLAMVCWF